MTKYTFLVAVGRDARSCIEIGPVLSFYPFGLGEDYRPVTGSVKALMQV